MLFNQKIALVTGASTGIGAAVATALYHEGATVIVTARNSHQLTEFSFQLDPSGNRVLARSVDVRDPESMRYLMNDIRQSCGALHHVVNNAGITGPHLTDIADYELADWQQVINTNISGTFYTMKYALPLIEASGGGSMVNLSAVNGMVSIKGIAPYTASKHAMIGLTQSAALEYAEKNIRINAVAPGYVATPKTKALPTEVQQWMAQQHPMQRMASVEEVAHTILFLLSPLSSFSTGAVYPIDGGYLAQ